MKNIWLGIRERKQEHLVASFGEARLVKQTNGRFELQGGSPDDLIAAQEWISLFMHEAAPVRSSGYGQRRI